MTRDAPTTLLGHASAEEKREEDEVIASVLQAGGRQIIGQIILTMQAFLDSHGLKGHNALTKLFDALSGYADDFRSSGNQITPEYDFVRLGVGRVFTCLMQSVYKLSNSNTTSVNNDDTGTVGGERRTVLPDDDINEAILMSPECTELLSTAMRAISSICKIPGQAAPMLRDGVLSAMSNILRIFCDLPPRKSERVVWWTINGLYYLIQFGEQQALLLGMEDTNLIHSLQTLANSPWNADKGLAVHVSLVTSKLATGFHAESVALQKKLLA